MHPCPNCDEPSITNKQKLFLSPGHTIVCPRCSGPIGLSSAVVGTYFPMFMGFFVYWQWRSWWSVLAVLLGGLAGLYIQVRHVPLWRPGVSGDTQRPFQRDLESVSRRDK